MRIEIPDAVWDATVHYHGGDPGGLAKTLIDIRHKHRLSQSALARMVGSTAGYISRLESGKRRPSREFLEQMAEALRLDAHDQRTLLNAAGYVTGFERDLDHEPEVVEILELLESADLPNWLLNLIRQQLRSLAAAALEWRRTES